MATPLWQLLAPYWRVLNSRNGRRSGRDDNCVSDSVVKSFLAWFGFCSLQTKESISEAKEAKMGEQTETTWLEALIWRLQFLKRWGLSAKLDIGAWKTEATCKFLLPSTHHRHFLTLCFWTTSVSFQGFWLPRVHSSLNTIWKYFFLSIFFPTQVVSERQLSTRLQKYNTSRCFSSWRVGKWQGVHCYAPSLRPQAKDFTMNDKQVQSLVFFVVVFFQNSTSPECCNF